MLVFFKVLCFVLFSLTDSAKHNVTYDSRSLLIDGERLLLLSGGMHYGRGTPTVWNHTMQLAKKMNLNTIQTYFLWNLHEHTSKGDLTWSNNKNENNLNVNLTQFLDTAMANDLYVTFRFGPYICGEFNYGGFPWWLRDISTDIHFRTYNKPFMTEMERILDILIPIIEPYFASNGGPIIMLQIENEYVYHPNTTFGEEYVSWAVNMAFNKTNEIPWIMCEHDPKFNAYSAIQTINGFWDEHNIDKTGWPSPEWINDHIKYYPNQPLFWTEDQAWYNGWNSAPLIRPVDIIANGILRWYALGGTYHNFYMLYGGNNFNRNAGGIVATAYANDAPINSYGIANNPKYSHLAKLFGVLASYSHCIVNTNTIPNRISIDINIEMISYFNDTVNLTFLSNIGPYFQSVDVTNDNNNSKQFTFSLAANSTILLDINFNVLFNSSHDDVTGEDLSMETYPDCILPGTSEDDIEWIDSTGNDWYYWHETYGIGGNLNRTISKSPIEMLRITSDQTEYIWYTPLSKQFRMNKQYCFQFSDIDSDQYMYIYDITNQELLISQFIHTSNKLCWNNTQTNLTWSNHKLDDKTYYNVSILVCSFGLINTGYTQETYTKGLIGKITLNGDNINESDWQSEGMLFGEYLKLYQNTSNSQVTWTKYNNELNSDYMKELTWWKTTFTTPMNLDVNTFESIAIDMIGATKGFIYVNGFNLGRYWLAESQCNGKAKSDEYLTMQWAEIYCQEHLPMQRYYSLPVDYLNANGKTNELVIIEEMSMKNPQNITIVYCQNL